MTNLNDRSQTVLGYHEKAIKCVASIRELSSVVSAGWDGALRMWDPRAKGASSVATLGAKAFSMGVSGTRIVVGCSARKVLIFDARKCSAPVHERESPLKFQTRCVACMQGIGGAPSVGYVTGSVEGRVSVDFFEQVGRKFSFKCHRKKVAGVEHIYPVNDFAFHPIYNTFASGGCDGSVCMWDWENKKRLVVIGQYTTSIAALDFNHDGSLLAIAASYTFEEGVEGLEKAPADQIYIRTVSESDAKPRPKASS